MSKVAIGIFILFTLSIHACCLPIPRFPIREDSSHNIVSSHHKAKRTIDWKPKKLEQKEITRMGLAPAAATTPTETPTTPTTNDDIDTSADDMTESSIVHQPEPHSQSDSIIVPDPPKPEPESPTITVSPPPIATMSRTELIERYFTLDDQTLSQINPLFRPLIKRIFPLIVGYCLTHVELNENDMLVCGQNQINALVPVMLAWPRVPDVIHNICMVENSGISLDGVQWMNMIGIFKCLQRYGG